MLVCMTNHLGRVPFGGIWGCEYCRGQCRGKSNLTDDTSHWSREGIHNTHKDILGQVRGGSRQLPKACTQVQKENQGLFTQEKTSTQQKLLVGRSLYRFRNSRFEPYTATQLYSPWPSQFTPMSLTSFVQKIGMRFVLRAIAVEFEFDYAQTWPCHLGIFVPC